MTDRKPLVVGADGRTQTLQSGDQIVRPDGLAYLATDAFGSPVFTGTFGINSIEDTITAHAGGGAGLATNLSPSLTFHHVTVCATAADSIEMPTVVVGQHHYVHNSGAAACQVFGRAGATINDIASATGISLPAGTGALFYGMSTQKWYTFGHRLGVDTDGTLAANSDNLIASQKATKTYADTKIATTQIGVSVQAYDADLDLWAGKTAPSGTVVGTSDSQTLTAKVYTPRVTSLVDGATVTLVPSTTDLGTVTLAGNRTLTISAGTFHGQQVHLEVTQSAGSNTLTADSTVVFSTDLPAWTLTTTAAAVDLLAFRWNSGASKWRFVGKVFGF